jgi:hypothetical protein
MAWLKRAWSALSIPVAFGILLAVTGCDSDSGDPMKASDGTPKKTPSEIRNEAKGAAPKAAP